MPIDHKGRLSKGLNSSRDLTKPFTDIDILGRTYKPRRRRSKKTTKRSTQTKRPPLEMPAFRTKEERKEYIKFNKARLDAAFEEVDRRAAEAKRQAKERALRQAKERAQRRMEREKKRRKAKEKGSRK